MLALIAWLGSSLREEVEKNTTAIHAVEKQLTDVHHVERRLTLLEAKEEADTRRLTERVRLLELELAKKN